MNLSDIQPSELPIQDWIKQLERYRQALKYFQVRSISTTMRLACAKELYTLEHVIKAHKLCNSPFYQLLVSSYYRIGELKHDIMPPYYHKIEEMRRTKEDLMRSIDAFMIQPYEISKASDLGVYKLVNVESNQVMYIEPLIIYPRSRHE